MSDQEAIDRALAIARILVKFGVPVFTARPDPENELGFKLPRAWQFTPPNLPAIDRWKPGYALCAVGGWTVDFNDMDPRNGGSESFSKLDMAGNWPTVYGLQFTPSGGEHHLIAPLRIRKAKREGIDHQGGDAMGNGRGFVFIAPTVRPSKITGEHRMYEWSGSPEELQAGLEALKAAGKTDKSGNYFAQWVTTKPAKTNGNGQHGGSTGFELPDVIPYGERDETLFKYASSLLSRELPRDEAEALMERAWRRCEQPSGDHYPLEKALEKLNRYEPGRSEGFTKPGTNRDGDADGQPPEWETDFWSSRESLAHISTYAYSRLASRWGVLGVCILRALQCVPHYVTLPGLIGGEGHFNSFIALVSPSGLGKGTCERCARDAFVLDDLNPVYEIDVGSGEGIAHQYKHFKRGERNPVWDRRAVLFKAAEVDQLGALAKRQGSTLLSQLRAAFSGESLGFAYADQTRRLPMEAGTYRFGLVVGVQPARSWVLLNDSDGGTPQRFVWLPAFDPNISADRPEAPKPISLDVRDSSITPWKPGPVYVPKEAEEEVVNAHVEKNRGNTDALNGHALYARLKIAMGLAVLADRRDINSEDWRLSGLVMKKSDAIRALCQGVLQAKQSEVEEAKAKGAGRSELIRTSLIEDSDMEKACTSLRTKLTNESPEWVNSKPLRDRLGRRRELFGEAIEKLMDTGEVEMQEVQHRSNTVTQYRLKK
jgi:hypothetical protein